MEEYYQPDKRWQSYNFKDEMDFGEKVVIKNCFNENVSKDIIEEFITAEYLMAHSYYYWPMFDEAFSKCLLILEMAVKIKANELRIPLTFKTKKGKILDKKLVELINDICEAEYLGELKIQLHRARGLRNMMVHPERHGFVGPNGLARNIQLFVNVINKLFQNEKSYKAEISEVRQASKKLSEIAKHQTLFLKKGYTGNGFLIHEVVDMDYFGNDLVLIIHPIPIPDMLKKEDFICSDPLTFFFYEAKFESNKLSGYTDEGVFLELIQTKSKEFEKLIDKYRNHLSNLSEDEISTSLWFQSSDSSWKLIKEEYEFNKRRFRSSNMQ